VLRRRPRRIGERENREAIARSGSIVGANDADLAASTRVVAAADLVRTNLGRATRT